MGYKGETFTRDFHLIRQTLVFFYQKSTGLFSCRFGGLGQRSLPGGLSYETAVECSQNLVYFSHASSYRENVASARRVYSGRKAVVFLPIELSLGVILNIPKTVLSNHAIHSPSLVDIT